MKVSRQWYKDCKSQEDKDKRIERVISSHYVLKVLSKILEDKLESNRQLQESKSNYESPAWSEQQADFIGSQRALRDIIDLLNIEE